MEDFVDSSFFKQVILMYRLRQNDNIHYQDEQASQTDELQWSILSAHGLFSFRLFAPCLIYIYSFN